MKVETSNSNFETLRYHIQYTTPHALARISKHNATRISSNI